MAGDAQIRQFTEAAMRRIAKATRDVEQMRREIRGRRRRGGFTYPNFNRPAIAYGNIPAGSSTEAGVGECKFFSINDDGTFGDPDDTPTTIYNLGTAISDGNRLIAELDIQGALESGTQAIWICGYDTATAGRHGFGTLSFSGTDFHNTGPGLVNLLSDGIESVNSDAGSPVVTFQAVGMNYDRIIVQDTGIWTLHFHAGMQPYPSAATPPASFESKVMRVLATGTAITEGAHIGNTDDVCGHEAFIRRSVWVLKETDFEAPSTDDSILFARFSSMYTCGRRYDHDFDRSFSIYLEEGDELSVWHDVDLDEETSSAYTDVPYQISLQLHYSDEPI